MRRTVLSLMILLLGVSLPAAAGQATGKSSGQAAQQPPQAAQQPTEAPEERPAVEAIRTTQDNLERLRLAEEFLQKYPESRFLGAVYATMAGAHRMQNNYPKAVEYGEKALEFNPSDIFSKMVIADALGEGRNPLAPDYQQKLERALVLAQEAVAELPAYLDSLPKQPGIPEQEYTRQRNLALANAYSILGFVHLLRAQFADAETALQQAVDLKPDPNDWLRLGEAYFRQRKYEEARGAFQRAVELGEGSIRESAQTRLERVERVLAAQKPATAPK